MIEPEEVVERRLKIMLRESERAAVYTAEDLSRLVEVYVEDMDSLFDVSILQDQPDIVLLGGFLMWERYASKYPDFDDRREALVKNMGVFIQREEDKPLPASKDSNVYSLFGHC